MDNETVKNIVGAIQRKCIEINAWIQSRLKGKSGLLRGGLLSKTIDYSGRFNAVGDVTLPVGYIGLPWQAILKLYEPFTLYHILKNPFNAGVKELIREQTGNAALDSAALKRFIVLLNEQPDVVSPLLRDELVKIAEEIVKDKVILYKRDPVENRDSYLSGFVRVDKDSFVAKLQTLDTHRTGGDFDGDTYAVFPLFTKSANEEARKKMNPRETKAMWVSPGNSNNISYIINLDAAAAIYTATKV